MALRDRIASDRNGVAAGDDGVSYYRRRLLEEGTVEFSDTSRGSPRAFYQLAAFTKDVAERVCGIVR